MLEIIYQWSFNLHDRTFSMKFSLIKALKSTQIRLLKPLIKKFTNDGLCESFKFSENNENLLIGTKKQLLIKSRIAILQAQSKQLILTEST